MALPNRNKYLRTDQNQPAQPNARPSSTINAGGNRNQSVPTSNAQTQPTTRPATSSNSTSQTKPQASIDWDDYREALEREKFDQQIQLANSQAQANRNIGAYSRASGFGSQGYGMTQQAMTRNSYANQMADAQASYLDQMAAIDEAEYNYNLEEEQRRIEEEQRQKDQAWEDLQREWAIEDREEQQSQLGKQDTSEAFQTMLADIGTTTGEDFFKRATSYGIIKDLGNGNYAIDENSDMWKGLTSSEQAYMKNLVNNAQENVNPFGGSSLEIDPNNLDSQNVSYYLTDSRSNVSNTGANDGMYNGKLSNFSNEINSIQTGINSGKYKNGDVIKIVNGAYGDWAYIGIYNGKMYYITEEQYNNSNSKKPQVGNYNG